MPLHLPRHFRATHAALAAAALLADLVPTLSRAQAAAAPAPAASAPPSTLPTMVITGSAEKNLGAVWLAAEGWSPYVNYSESFEPVSGTDATGALFKPQRGKQVEAGVKWQPTQTKLSAIAKERGFELREQVLALYGICSDPRYR